MLKKSICATLILLLTASLLVFTVGCGGDGDDAEKEYIDWRSLDFDSMDPTERAGMLQRVADQEMELLDSYTASAETGFTCTVNGIEATATINAEISCQGQTSGNYSQRNYSKAKVSAAGQTSIAILTDGYQDGYMFKRTSIDSYGSNLKSAISVNDYREYLKVRSSDMIDIPNGNELQCTASSKKTEGGWRVSLSGFDSEYMESVNELMGVTELMGKSVITDIELNIYITQDMIYDRIEMNYVVDGNEENFSMDKCDLVFSDINATEVKRSAIEGYNEVYDLRLIDALEKELDAIKKSESGSFELEITQSVSNGFLGSKLTTETDKVNYTITDGKINFTCDADIDGDKYTISYKDGERTVVYYENGEVEETHTDKPANENQIEFVTKLLTMHYFEKNYIKNIEKVEGKDEYIVTLYPHAEFLAAFDLDSGFKLYNRDYTLTFTMNDGKISELKVDTMSDKNIKISYKFFSYG